MGTDFIQFHRPEVRKDKRHITPGGTQNHGTITHPPLNVPRLAADEDTRANGAAAIFAAIAIVVAIGGGVAMLIWFFSEK